MLICQHDNDFISLTLQTHTYTYVYTQKTDPIIAKVSFPLKKSNDTYFQCNTVFSEKLTEV